MQIKDKILIVEDDEGILRYLHTTLLANGYQAIVAADGRSALALAASHCPTCILLDLGLPDIDGGEVIRQIRQWSTTPIIVISARSTETDKAEALDTGADDYLTKPFGTVELLARIRTAIRHSNSMSDQNSIALTGTYEVGELFIDFRKHRVSLGSKDINLTPNEFRIVALLARHAGQVLTYKSMLHELWGPAASSDNKILRVHMANIRRKLEPNPDEPRYIFTEIGVGYRMADSEDHM
ncbi:MAG: response regulator transcription factor [Ruminococcaceae bacterium]|nr:response regulator transcription factor [Oscillospiraceae bacterium]